MVGKSGFCYSYNGDRIGQGQGKANAAQCLAESRKAEMAKELYTRLHELLLTKSVNASEEKPKKDAIAE